MLNYEDHIKGINEYYDKVGNLWADTYDTKDAIEVFSFTGNIESHNHTIMQRSCKGIIPNFKFLDCGCGHFTFGKYLTEQLNCTGIGININDTQIKRAIQNIQGNSRAEIIKADYNKLPFSDSVFDRVYFIESFSHSLYPKITLTEAFRVLNPGGKLYGIILARKNPILPPSHYELYKCCATTKEELESYITQTQFKIESIEILSNLQRLSKKYQRINEGFYLKNSTKRSEFGEIHSSLEKNGFGIQHIEIILVK